MIQFHKDYPYEAKWCLRYVLVALGFLLLCLIEGMMLRTKLVIPEFLQNEHYYSVMTIHPLIGIYGYGYMAIMGAFYFLIPYLLKTQIYFRNFIPLNFFLQTIGLTISWFACFLTNFNSLYTLYWPLPVSFDRISSVGVLFFILGLAIVFINILLFSFNLFTTLVKKNPILDHDNRPYRLRDYIKSAFGFDYFRRKENGEKEDSKRLYDRLPVFVVAVARGSIDTVINASVLLFLGVIILIYAIPSLAGLPLFDTLKVDALLYKNLFWWGLDMVADGNVLMYTAGTWYLLVPLLVGRKLFGEKLVRMVILADLLVSMFVWSHHLLGEESQPKILRLISGQFVTSGEIITLALTLFTTMMTIYLARPVKFSPALKFVLTSMFGFMLGSMSGIISSNFGLNVVLHNTQWVIGAHAHMMLLLGLSPLLFAVVYALIPMLFNKDVKSPLLVNLHLFFWISGTLTMTLTMGNAGLRGMLRRTLYTTNLYLPEMSGAFVGGAMIILGFGCLLANLVLTLGFKNLVNFLIPLPISRKALTS